MKSDPVERDYSFLNDWTVGEDGRATQAQLTQTWRTSRLTSIETRSLTVTR
jgi:hypothetical protein